MFYDLVFLMTLVICGHCLRKTCFMFMQRGDDDMQLLLQQQQPDVLPAALTVPIIIRCSAYKDFTPESENTSHESCSICIEEYEEDSTVAVLEKCNHMYHEQCISEWLKKSTLCPLCNT